MIVSLVLLASFLVFYILDTFQTKKKDLQKEAKYILENAFKTNEAEELNRMMIEINGQSWLTHKSQFRKVEIVGSSTSDLGTNSFPISEDTLNKVGAVMIQTLDENIKHDSNFNIKFNFNYKTKNIDTNITLQPKTEIRKIDKLFLEGLSRAKFNIKYELSSDSLKRGHLENPTHTEVFKKTKYYLNVDNNNGFLLKKMVREILLSLGLFLAVLFAFFHIIRSYRKKQEYFDIKEDFIRNMTHELKTPIATIGVALEAIQNFEGSKDEMLRQEYYRIAESQNQKLNSLVDKVLSISQHMDNNIENKEVIDLNLLVQEIVESFKLRSSQKNILLQVVNQLSHPSFQINQQLFVIALHNLIENAIKYIVADSPKVTIKLSESTDKLTIAVEDNGEPIPEMHRTKIFDKFYRIPKGDVHDVKGHGLGLYIVTQLANSMKGGLSLSSTESGNTFTLTIPKEL